jgi:hypothetical protein
MSYERRKIVSRRHRDDITVSVSAHPHIVGYTVVAEAGGTSEFLGQAVTLRDAQRLADEHSGCAQPCSCPPWSTLTAL